MFNRQLKKFELGLPFISLFIRSSFGLGTAILHIIVSTNQFNRIQQGYSRLKTSVEFHSLENRSQSKLFYPNYFKCIMYFVCGKGLNSKQALLFAALK